MTVTLKPVDYTGLRNRLLATAYAQMTALQGRNEPQHKKLDPSEINAIQADLEAILGIWDSMEKLERIQAAFAPQPQQEPKEIPA